MLLINCKVELKLKWTMYCVLSTAGADNNDADSNNIIFTTKDTKLYIPIVTLSAKDNRKISKLLRKRFERSVCWNEYKTKNENKNAINEYRCFLESNFVGVNRLFLLVIQIKMAMLKDLKLKYIIYQKVLFKIIK